MREVTGMFSGSDRVLQRGAARWERLARNRRSLSTQLPSDDQGEAVDTGSGRHRTDEETVPWRRRPRAQLDSALHRIYLGVVWVIVMFLWVGGVSVLAGPSLTARLGGVAAVACGLTLAALVVLYLRRPVKR